MRVWLDTGGLAKDIPAFTLDFITANTKTHALCTEQHKQGVYRILQQAKDQIIKLFEEGERHVAGTHGVDGL